MTAILICQSIRNAKALQLHIAQRYRIQHVKRSGQQLVITFSGQPPMQAALLAVARRAQASVEFVR